MLMVDSRWCWERVGGVYSTWWLRSLRSYRQTRLHPHWHCSAKAGQLRTEPTILRQFSRYLSQSYTTTVTVAVAPPPRLLLIRPVWVQGHCRTNPPRFQAKCRKRRLNQGSFVLLYFRLSTLLYRPKPIHCNYQLVHYSGFCRISPSILNRFTPNLQAQYIVCHKTRLRAFLELFSSSGFRARRRRDFFVMLCLSRCTVCSESLDCLTLA